MRGNLLAMLDPALIEKYHQPIPRYTSYPTAVQFEPIDASLYEKKISELGWHEPLSLYFHIPFCKTMCLYCACSVVLNRKASNEERYVDYLHREIDLFLAKCGEKKKVHQIHFGGGTPTKLSIPLFERLFKKIDASFSIDYSKEVAIEIDPRTVLEKGGEKLYHLRQLGFNRISLGIQDTSPEVQEAIKRHQTLEMTTQAFELARTLQFSGINIDLIYGLPCQTMESFTKTIDLILELRPDRIALFSYAKVPWLKPHQKAINEAFLPTTSEKFAIYVMARQKLIANGYLAIGMDHFALQTDEMAKGYLEKRLCRNFQGYSCLYAEEMVSFGLTAIGCIKNMYVQNVKELSLYYALLDKGQWPLERGKVMSDEDILRKYAIHKLMCNFTLNKQEVEKKFSIDFSSHFAASLMKINELEADGLLLNDKEKISVTSKGELFIRNIAACFDAYLSLSPIKSKFSQSI